MESLRISGKTLYVGVIVLLFGGFTVAALLSGGGGEVTRIGQLYLERGFEMENFSNTVFGVYGMYRFYDTLFELLIFSTAVLGITIFSDLESSPSPRSGRGVESHVVTTSASFLYPVIAVIGIYLAYSAHQGPGGGFAGGAISGTGILLLALAKGAEETGKRFHESLMKRVEYFVLLLALVIAVTGMYFPQVTYSGLQGVGVIVLVNVSIATKVFIGTWSILHFFVKHRGEV